MIVPGRRLVVQVSRILDASAFKQAIADRGAIFGLIVSPFVYETYIVPRRDSREPANYARIPVRVKETSTTAWMQLMDPAGAVLPPRQHLILPGERRRGQDGHFQLVISGASSPWSRV